MLERNTPSYHGIPLEYKTEDEMLVTVKKYGQAFLPYSPYMQGLLTGRFTREKKFSSTDIRNENPRFMRSIMTAMSSSPPLRKRWADR